MSKLTLKDWLTQAPFTLTLSSGFFSFFAHTGLLSVLEEEGLLPQRITGASAGALSGGLWASGVSAQTLAKFLFELQKNDFWDPSIGLGLLKGRLFRQIMRDISPVTDVDKTKIPLTVSVFNGLSRKTESLSTGPIDKVIYASCAVPLLFQPIWLDGALYWDGGIKDRPAMSSIKPGERVLYHHILSRSPWRRKNSDALKIPDRPDTQVLAFDDLPRVGPNRLSAGKLAFDVARERTRHALAKSVL